MASATAPERAEPGWLTARRERAVALSGELGLPMYKGKPGWEFTELTGLELAGYPESAGRSPEPGPDVEPILAFPEGASALGCDGELAGRALPEGVIVASLPLAAERHGELVARHFGTLVESNDLLLARNEAQWSAGAFVYVPRGVVVEQPIVIGAAAQLPGEALHRRALIVLEEGAQAEVWEEYASVDRDADGLFNAVVELSVGPAARLRYVCAQALSLGSWLFASQRAEVARDGTLEWVALGFGSARGRVRMETNLAGRGASAKVTGAYAAGGRQHLDYDTTQEHAAPNTTSDLAFRGVLAERSSAVWRGMIRVDPGAQQTDAFQESRNLLLSKRAHADAIPGLEIEANDVRCTHAAAIAQIDPDQLFYLSSRGLPRGLAQRLVIDGFMEALVERFEHGPLRSAVAGALESRLATLLGAL